MKVERRPPACADIAANAEAWAIVKRDREGLKIRAVRWHRLLARFERRSGEEVRAARILLAKEAD